MIKTVNDLESLAILDGYQLKRVNSYVWILKPGYWINTVVPYLNLLENVNLEQPK